MGTENESGLAAVNFSLGRERISESLRRLGRGAQEVSLGKRANYLVLGLGLGVRAHWKGPNLPARSGTRKKKKKSIPTTTDGRRDGKMRRETLSSENKMG